MSITCHIHVTWLYFHYIFTLSSYGNLWYYYNTILSYHDHIMFIILSYPFNILSTSFQQNPFISLLSYCHLFHIPFHNPFGRKGLTFSLGGWRLGKARCFGQSRFFGPSSCIGQSLGQPESWEQCCSGQSGQSRAGSLGQLSTTASSGQSRPSSTRLASISASPGCSKACSSGLVGDIIRWRGATWATSWATSWSVQKIFGAGRFAGPFSQAVKGKLKKYFRITIISIL